MAIANRAPTVIAAGRLRVFFVFRIKYDSGRSGRMSKSRAAVRIDDANRHFAGAIDKEIAMKQYLLSVCYPADATQPAPDALQRIMRDVNTLRKEMQAAGAWIFSGGLHPASTATVVRE